MLNPALEFCMSACVTEMRGDYNFEKCCNDFNPPHLVCSALIVYWFIQLFKQAQMRPNCCETQSFVTR